MGAPGSPPCTVDQLKLDLANYIGFPIAWGHSNKELVNLVQGVVLGVGATLAWGRLKKPGEPGRTWESLKSLREPGKVLGEPGECEKTSGAWESLEGLAESRKA